MKANLLPETSRYPHVEKLIRILKRTALVAVVGFAFIFFITGITFVMVPRNMSRSIGDFFGICMLGSLLILFLSGLLYAAVVIIYYVKVSLLQLLTSILLIGFFVGLTIKVPGDAKILPIFMLLVIVWSIGLEAVRQDPTGEAHVPDFVRRQRANKVREKIRKRRDEQARCAREKE